MTTKRYTIDVRWQNRLNEHANAKGYVLSNFSYVVMEGPSGKIIKTLSVKFKCPLLKEQSNAALIRDSINGLMEEIDKLRVNEHGLRYLILHNLCHQ